jgi:serine/threonine protein kinase
MVVTRAATQTLRMGRYQIVERLAEGGMADVLLARTVGIEGFERHVVIKRIRADQARDIRYVTMFLDEARLAASLHHANIVQVNDIGQEDGDYFFAMEYVHGEDARHILKRSAEIERSVPLEHVLAIVIGAAAGLHHAHEQIRPDGNSLGIVHRDVSPANILIGYDGGVKVVDFGIAKAAHQHEETQSGLLKGKVAYMSPEQCNNERVDRRSDVFALGIVLHELVTVRPLFMRENDFLTMSAIVHDRVPPPSQIKPGVPAELDAIVVKALARNPADRYQTADEMRRALELFAERAGVRTSTTALSDYMKQLFGERREPWLVDRAATPLPMLEDIPREVSSDDADDDLDIQISDAPPATRPAISAVPRRRRALWIGGCLAIAAIAVALFVVGHHSAPAAPVKTAQAPRVLAAPAPAPVPVASVPVANVPVASPAVVETAPPALPVHAKKDHPKRTKTEPKKHWDPNALFPE